MWPQTTHRSNPAGGKLAFFSCLSSVVEIAVLVVLDLLSVEKEDDTDPEGAVRVDFAFWDDMAEFDELGILRSTRIKYGILKSGELVEEFEEGLGFYLVTLLCKYPSKEFFFAWVCVYFDGVTRC